MIFKMTTRREGQVEFESKYTDAEVADRCAKLTSDFAQSLASKRDKWSHNQRAWAHYLVFCDEKRGEQPPKRTGFEAIVSLFDAAVEGSLKYPKLHFDIEVDGNEAHVRMNRAGSRSKNPGCVHVTDGQPYGTPGAVYYGRIDRDGSTTVQNPDVIDLLRRLAHDPDCVVRLYGQKSGHCCFCAKRLTDARSLAAGYGPICATNWGLREQWAKAVEIAEDIEDDKRRQREFDAQFDESNASPTAA